MVRGKYEKDYCCLKSKRGNRNKSWTLQFRIERPLETGTGRTQKFEIKEEHTYEMCRILNVVKKSGFFKITTGNNVLVFLRFCSLWYKENFSSSGTF